MRILLDTHVLVWAIGEPRRLSARAQAAIADPDSEFAVSAVIAWEYADLRQRGRLASAASLDIVVRALSLAILDVPATVWQQADTLPNHHRDPVDRMLIAHALEQDLTVMTADRKIRVYPLRTLW